MRTFWFFICFNLLWPAFGQAAGFMIVPGDARQLYCLEHRSLKADVKIAEQMADVSVEQVFYNPTNARLEAYFCFPVPKGAVVTRFNMFINGRETPAELLDAQRARQYYEDIVRKMKDPALFEYVDQAMYRIRIFPIEPRSEKKITFSYSFALKRDNGLYQLVLPLNTQRFSAAPLRNANIQVNISTKQPLKNLFSPTHVVKLNRNGDHEAQVILQIHGEKPDRDFELFYGATGNAISTSMLQYVNHKEDGFFYLDISPGEHDAKPMPKDITFILDISGSMAGEKMEQARKALSFCINQLRPDDCFEVIAFSTEARALFKGLEPASSEHIKQALDFVKSLQAIGGTNMEEAFKLALARGGIHSPHYVVFITDGKPTIGETDEQQLLSTIRSANAKQNRIFTVGVGYDINTALLDQITLDTRAFRTYVTPEEDLEIKLSDFYQKISSPVMTDVELKFEGPVEVYHIFPKHLPDLFRGSSLDIMGRFRGQGNGKAILKGKVNQQPVSYTYDLRFDQQNNSHPYLPNLWANRYVGYMLDEIRLKGENRELIEEIKQIARTYGIITPYTSYLILEDEMQQVQNGTVRRENEVILYDRVAREAPAAIRQNQEAYLELKVKDGDKGVRASKKAYGMANASNYSAANVNDSTMVYRNKSGVAKALNSDIRMVNGRAFYLNNQVWVDGKTTKAQPKTVDVKFGSQEYFTLAQQTEVRAYLALGRNVQFLHNGNYYRITD